MRSARGRTIGKYDGRKCGGRVGGSGANRTGVRNAKNDWKPGELLQKTTVNARSAEVILKSWGTLP